MQDLYSNMVNIVTNIRSIVLIEYLYYPVINFTLLNNVFLSDKPRMKPALSYFQKKWIFLLRNLR